MYRSIKWYGVLCLLLVIGLSACKSYLSLEAGGQRGKIYPVETDKGIRKGDPAKGYEYLIYGGYVGNGIPAQTFLKFFKPTPDTVLQREGENATIPYQYTLFENAYGDKVVNGNCFTCHASAVEGEIVLGLGDSFGDYTRSTKSKIKLLNWLIKRKYGKDSETWQHYAEQAAWFKSVADAVQMDNPGINPAFRIEEATIQYRDPIDLSFQDSARFQLSRATIGTDVPPLWNLRKKKVLYYNGMGRGDYSKLLMQACLLGIHDSTAARGIQQNFHDVIAWLEQLEPPSYPKDINPGLALEGKSVFQLNCSKCHGRYGKKETYPNKIIALDKIKTDSLYALYAMQSPVNDWYNQSWFHNSPPFAESRPSMGYIAPPLDGVWATAPYLHNGSVPTLEALLDSRKRPIYWKRDAKNPSYDFDRVGWEYETRRSGRGRKTYDTTIPGYGNQGHYFGDKLTQRERKAVIEYLKTL